jgi:ketosteroid isomerase-like protein
MAGSTGKGADDMTRTPEEVFAHHGQALGAEDLEEIIADYSDDAILVVQKKVYRGKDGAREVFTQLLSELPQAQWQLETVFADDVLYLEWKATAGDRKVEDGIDTFIFADGLIRVQTVVFTLGSA